MNVATAAIPRVGIPRVGSEAAHPTMLRDVRRISAHPVTHSASVPV